MSKYLLVMEIIGKNVMLSNKMVNEVGSSKTSIYNHNEGSSNEIRNLANSINQTKFLFFRWHPSKNDYTSIKYIKSQMLVNVTFNLILQDEHFDYGVSGYHDKPKNTYCGTIIANKVNVNTVGIYPADGSEEVWVTFKDQLRLQENSY